ncbi:MAG TPA: transglutaminase-like domain-containing protein [Gemmatimonadales bacterium]|nr:transglutaminase-like domain-containing protein [Gemmatimonadales bacterium]
MRLYRPSPRAWAAIAVLVAWGASLTWLGTRRLTQTESATLSSEALLRLAPGASWFALYSGALQVGQAGITLDTLSPGYQVLENFSLETPQDAMVLRASRSTVTKVSAALLLDSIQSRSVRGDWQDSWTVTVREGRLRIRGGDTPDGGAETAVSQVPTTTAILPFRLALSGGLVEGRGRTVASYLGAPGVLGRLRVEAGRDSMAVFADSTMIDPATGALLVAHTDSARARAVLFRGDGPAERWWIDSRGRVVGIETAFGLRWVRTDFDLASSALRNRGAERAATLRSHYPPIAVLTRPDTGRRERRYLLGRRDGRPLDRELMAPLASGRQELRGDTLVVLSGSRSPGADRLDSLPRDPLSDETDPGVIALVTAARRNIPASRTDDSALIDALVREVARRVTLDTALTAPVGASAALTRQRARAEGMARLFVAAARAAGLSARLAIGIRPVGDGFESHAWAEVRTTGLWNAVDPAFGRPRAATDLIRLGSSGPTAPWQLLPRVAQLRITALPSAEENR